MMGISKRARSRFRLKGCVCVRYKPFCLDARRKYVNLVGLCAPGELVGLSCSRLIGSDRRPVGSAHTSLPPSDRSRVELMSWHVS